MQKSRANIFQISIMKVIGQGNWTYFTFFFFLSFSNKVFVLFNLEEIISVTEDQPFSLSKRELKIKAKVQPNFFLTFIG